VRLRRARGVASDLEVAQAEALLQQARTTIPLLRVDLEAQLNRLDVLMGAQPGTYAKELATAADVPAIPAISSDDRPLDVLRRRPDVIAAERQVAAANARIGVAISDYYPKISLSGVLAFESLAVAICSAHAPSNPVGTGALRWRLFDFGKVSAEVARRAVPMRKPWRATNNRYCEPPKTLKTHLSRWCRRSRTRELQDEVASLTRARDLSQQSHVAGVTHRCPDSDRQLLVARDDLAHTQADTARAAVRTYRALGGGWSSELHPLAQE
jgi:outer membrane protein TolC